MTASEKAKGADVISGNGPVLKKPSFLHRLFALGSSEQVEALRTAFNHVVRDSLHPVTLWASALHGLLVLVYALVLPETIAPIMITVAGGAAIVLLLLHLVLRWVAVPVRWAHPLSTLVVSLTLFTGLTHLYLSREPRQTIIILFVVIALGLFFLSVRWFALVLAETVIGWALVAQQLPLTGQLIYFGFTLLIGSGLSVLVFIVRRRAFLRYELLRLQDERHKRELRHRAGQLETSIAVGKHIISILDLDTLLNQVAELIKARYGYSYVGIYILEENGAYLRVRAGTGEVGRSLCRQNFKLRVGEEGLIGWVAAHRRPARVDDVTEDSRYLQVGAVSRTRSELDLPLQVGNSLLGVLNLQSEQLAAFPEDDVPFLQLLADQVAIAIHNAFQYQGEKSARHLAETLQYMGRALTSTLDWEEVLELLLEHLAQIVSYDRAGVLVKDGTELEMVAARGFPPESQPRQIRISLDNETIFTQIYHTQRPLSIRDAAERPDWKQIDSLPTARAWLGVPLIRSDEVIGMLSLARETTDAYTDEEITLAEAFAGQAAVALGNARLYDKSTRFTQQLEYEVRQRTRAIQEAYERLEQLDRTKSDFISIASHELRTPLTILRGYSQMLLKDELIMSNERHQWLVAGMQAGSQRLEEIVNSMLDVAKIDSRALKLYPEPVSLPALIQLVSTEFEEALAERDLRFVVEDMRNLPAIEADPEALQKVFYHLVINAIKYTPDGGLITISGRSLPPGSFDLSGRGVEIVVSDTGIGIDPDFHELIFTKFYQTGEVALHSTGKTVFKGGGPGLGLAIASGIVEAHRGKLWVESSGHDEEVNPGSQFHVVLPLTQNRSVTVEESPATSFA
ncbi:MAG TPA: GAF domain-containing protein [Anaerolineae bacterium]